MRSLAALQDEAPAYYSPSTMADICGVYRKTVRTWIIRGKLPATKSPGGYYRILPLDALAFLRQYKYPIPAHLLPLMAEA